MLVSLRKYRLLRLAVAATLVLGVSLPLVRYACAMSGMWAEVSSPATDSACDRHHEQEPAVTVPNPGLQFKRGMYATVQLVGSHSEPLPVVPAEAVVRTGEKEIVILALGEGRFRPQPVRAGMQSGDRVQILHGLDGGERVVTSAQFLIDSEARLQSAIGSMVGVVDMAPVEDAPAPAVDSCKAKAGAQIVPITVTPTGFAPNRISLKKGTPTELVFTRTGTGGCIEKVQISDMHVAATDLPVGEPVSLQVTPTQTGTFTFACGMDMVKGSILVVAAG